MNGHRCEGRASRRRIAQGLARSLHRTSTEVPQGTVMLTTGILGKLHRDHDSIRRLITDINEIVDTGSTELGHLFAELKSGLVSYCAAEECVLYAALAVHEECRDEVKDGREEHEEIEEILRDLERAEDEEEWLSTFQELEDAVLHHLSEVEGETFPTAMRVLGRDELMRLAEVYHREKSRARARITGQDDAEDEESEPDEELRMTSGSITA
jgi:hypothetical protein